MKIRQIIESGKKDSSSRVLAWTGDVGSAFHRTAIHDLLNVMFDKECSQMVIFLNSPGGYLDSASSILHLMDEVKRSGVEIIMIAAGRVESAAFIIFLNGDVRYCQPDSSFMLHKPWLMTSGNEVEISKNLKDLRKKAYGDALMKKVKMTQSQKLSYTRGEDVEFNITQALRNGILTGRLR